MAHNIRYVNHAIVGGNDDGTTEVDAWKYIWQATAVMRADAAGVDQATTNQWTIYVKASESYGVDGTDPNPSESDDVDHDGAGGSGGSIIHIDFIATSDSAPNVFEGYSSSINDGGIATLNCNYDGANDLTYGIRCSSNVAYRTIFKNFDIINAGADGVFGSTTGDNITFKNCRFKNNTSEGVTGDNNLSFENCVFDGNGADGIDVDSSLFMVSCISRNNTLQGIHCISVVLYETLVYDNGNVEQIIVNGSSYILSCTIDADEDGGNNSSECIRQDGSSPLHIVNTIIYDATTGILADSVLGQSTICRNNLINGNTTPGTNYPFEYDGGTTTPSTGDGVGDLGNVTSAPGFTGTYVPGSNPQSAGLDAHFTNAFWVSFDAAANPPFT